jgi:BirA family biotin operon repressor/biotin-[acetyl-CoA-carboxylase] ligase
VEIWESPLWTMLLGREGWIRWDEIASRIKDADRSRALILLASFREAGFGLEEDARLGCRVVSKPDRLFPPWIRHGLDTTVFGRRLVYAHTLESTQSEAVARAKAGEPEGTVVLCEYQSRGRGRRGRAWHSPPYSNVLMSILIRSPGPPQQGFVWTQIAALAAAEAAETVAGRPIGIKWPNDLYLEDRKLCGVLAERNHLGGGEDVVVVGIGLNVYARPDDGTAICLRDVHPGVSGRAELVKRILESFESRCLAVRCRGPGVVWEAWLGRSLLLNKPVQVRYGSRVLRGVVEGFQPDGVLRLRCASGRRRLLTVGDVSLLRLEAHENRP